MDSLLRVPLDALDTLTAEEQVGMLRALFDTLNKAMAQRDDYAQRLDAMMNETMVAWKKKYWECMKFSLRGP